MQAVKMATIVRQHRSLERSRVSEDVGISNALIGAAGLISGQNIVAEAAKELDEFQRHVLIAEEGSHGV